MAQRPVRTDDTLLTIPSAAQVKGITIEPGGIDAYTPQSLLKILPYLVPTGGVYLKPKFPQKGTITLKNGTVLRWIAIDRYSLELQGRKRGRLFMVPAECSITGPADGPLRTPGRTVFRHSETIEIRYQNQEPSVVLGYSPLEESREFENVQGFSAEFKCVNDRAADHISFRFWATRRLSKARLSLIADGRIIKEAILRTPTDESMTDFGWIIYAIDLPRTLFQQMIRARRVELRVGEGSFTLSADQLESLRDLYSRMEP
jgi:hypothetical protein